jgi:hypothetical protein
MKRLLAGAALLLCAFSAHAGIVRADFRTEAGLPTAETNEGPLVHQRLGASVGAGYELDGSDFLANPSGWEGGEVWVDLDPLTNILRLIAKDTFDFQTFRFSMSNIAGTGIVGIAALGDTLTDTGAVPFVDFSSDALAIVYEVTPGAFHFKGSASFQLLTSDPASPVPEPAALALFGLGAGMLGLGRRRKLKDQARQG